MQPSTSNLDARSAAVPTIRRPAVVGGGVVGGGIEAES